MLTVINQTLAQNAPGNTSANSLVDVAGLETPEAIIALLKSYPGLTRQQLADGIGKDIRTIGRALVRLQTSGKVKRIGGGKKGYWEVQL